MALLVVVSLLTIKYRNCSIAIVRKLNYIQFSIEKSGLGRSSSGRNLLWPIESNRYFNRKSIGCTNFFLSKCVVSFCSPLRTESLNRKIYIFFNLICPMTSNIEGKKSVNLLEIGERVLFRLFGHHD